MEPVDGLHQVAQKADDLDASVAFYRDVLGLRLLADEEHALVFDTGGTTLRIQKVREAVPPSYTVLGWSVPDIRKAVRSLVAKGTRMQRYDFLPQDDDGIWTTPTGERVAWFRDPDGNTLSLTQF